MSNKGHANIGTPQVLSRAAVALAVSQGIVTLIKSMVNIATDKMTLLLALKDHLGGGEQPINKPLADALNMELLDLILTYMGSVPGSEYVPASAMPKLLPQAGPASFFAARDGGLPTQLNISFTAPPAGFTYEVYQDAKRVLAGSQAAQPSGEVWEVVQGVPQDGEVKTFRVLFVRTEDGALTLFGPAVSIL